MDIAIMIEGQDGLNWSRWRALALRVEALGFAGLYRSDHFTNGRGPLKDSLELWISLAWLATATQRIDFGPLVTPVSFRDPIFTARMARDVDDLSGGRLTLGLGAGWQEREHAMFGYDLLDTASRFARFEEGLRVTTGLLRSAEPVSLQGDWYTLRDATLLPRPQRPGGPPILIGGNGTRRTLPLVARFADEWNAVYVTADRFRKLSRQLDDLIMDAGRRPESVRRSMMAGLVFGLNDRVVYEKLAGDTIDAVRARGMLVGTSAALREQLAELAEAGVQRVMLQWLELDALDDLEALARGVL